MNVVVECLGFRRGSPIIKTGLVESLRQEVRGKVDQETKVDQDSSGEVNKLDGTSSNGRFATSAKDGI